VRFVQSSHRRHENATLARSAWLNVRNCGYDSHPGIMNYSMTPCELELW
jgi:hypothetical protein